MFWPRSTKIPAVIAQRAEEFGYSSWPKKIKRYIRRRDVLDIGCGRGLHGIGYLRQGARTYVGVDPGIDLDSDIAKNQRTKNWTGFGWTGRDLMREIPEFRLVSGNVEGLCIDEKFDVIVMHTVTEHLMNIEEVFSCLPKLLRSNGQIVFKHGNFYSWNGHHGMPRTIRDIDLEDSAQRRLVDWAHLDRPETKHRKWGELNLLRLDEVRALTERYFTIDQWTEVPTKPKFGADRLTPQIKARHSEYSERDLTIQSVFCVATRR